MSEGLQRVVVGKKKYNAGYDYWEELMDTRITSDWRGKWFTCARWK